MPIVPQSPAPALFGYDVASPENKNKSLLAQCSAAMRANSVAVADPIPAVGETPIDIEKRWLKALIAAAVTAGVPVPAPAFSGTKLDDGQSQQVSTWGRALFDALRTAGYIA